MAKNAKEKTAENKTGKAEQSAVIKPGKVRLRDGFTIVIDSKVFEGPFDLEVDERTFIENEHKFELIEDAE